MYARLSVPAAAFLAALLAMGATPSATKPRATPSPTPLKTIKHIYSTSRLCSGLARSIGPAVQKVLQNDRTIAASRPLFQDFTKRSSEGSSAGKDITVARLEMLIRPLVQNIEGIEKLLADPVYAHRAQNDNDKQLLLMRAQLRQVLEQQKHALDLISGFVDTEQLGQLKAAGHEYDSAVGAGPTPTPSANIPRNNQDEILNAGVQNPQTDLTLKNDPRYQSTGNALGYNPLNAFDQQMHFYQSQIDRSESAASQTILKAVPVCGGHAPADQPASAAPAPSPSPTPSPTP